MPTPTDNKSNNLSSSRESSGQSSASQSSSSSAPNAQSTSAGATAGRSSVSSQSSTRSQETGRASAQGIQIPSSISEALRMLDQALSRDGANLRELVSSEYSALRHAIEDMAPKMGQAFRQYGSQAAEVIQDYAGEGLERGKVVAGRVDSRVRANPWPVIGGVALGSLVVGYWLGRGGAQERGITGDLSMSEQEEEQIH
ncbi:MAG: hypothetical protein NDI61_04770 [Bdellovibrionaceae bacterium]|nr:hypothetical protein [Pseudobdellovibrionaceae bacterium]